MLYGLCTFLAACASHLRRLVPFGLVPSTGGEGAICSHMGTAGARLLITGQPNHTG